MGFRVQKRINLGGGLGINIGKKGFSTSYRGKSGSISSKGYTIKTGIPGVSYRSSGKSGCLVVIVFIIGIIGILQLFL